MKCEHLTGVFDTEHSINKECPWCEINKLMKRIRELEQKLKDERGNSRRVLKENLKLQERLERLEEREL